MERERPLAGKRVVVTRAPEQAGEMVEILLSLGAEVLHAPAVSYLEPEQTEPLDRALRAASEFDWLILSSQNVVRFLTRRCAALEVNARAFAGKRPKVAAVGKATAEAAREAGWPVDFVASRFQGLALAEELGEQLRGRKVLLPRSSRARPELPEALRKWGAQVAEVIAYRTEYAAPETACVEAIRAGKVDVLTFASPSAFHALADGVGLEALRRHSGRMVCAAIGPVTAAAIRDAGLRVHIEAGESTAAGMVAAIADYFRRRPVSSGVSQS